MNNNHNILTMLAKKHQKYDFRKNATLFFSLGLLSMTIISYFVIELELEKVTFSDLVNVKQVDEFEEKTIHYTPKLDFTPIKQQVFVENYRLVTIEPEPIDNRSIVNIPEPSSHVPTTTSTDNLPRYVEPEPSDLPEFFLNLEDTPVFQVVKIFLRLIEMRVLKRNS